MVGDGEEVHRGGLPEKLDPGMLNDPRQEDLFDGRAGLVLVMKDARQGMGSLRRQVPFLIVARRAVEIDSDLIDQNFFNQSRPSRLNSQAASGELRPAPAWRMSCTSFSGESSLPS